MTSFEKIFNIFMSETKHTSLAKLSESDLVYILEHYLETSAMVEFKKCRKDLSKYTKTSFRKLINGYPVEEMSVSDFPYVKPDDGEEVDPDFSQTYPKPPVGDGSGEDNFLQNFIETYEIEAIGYFEEVLSYEECYILALSMILHQLQSNLNREEYFRRTISDRDFKLAGGDKILASIMELETSTRKKLKKYKNSYSYNYFNELKEI